MAKIKTVFSNPEPLLTLMNPQLIHIVFFFFFFFLFLLSWTDSHFSWNSEGERSCGWFTPSTQNSLSSAGSPQICLPWWWSNGWKAPFPLLKEVLSRHISSPLSCLFSLALKLTAFLQRKSLSPSSSIEVSFFVFHVLSHSSSSEGKI